MKKLIALFCFVFACFSQSIFCAKHDVKIVCGEKRKIPFMKRGRIVEMYPFLDNKFITVRCERGHLDYSSTNVSHSDLVGRFTDWLEIRDEYFDLFKKGFDFCYDINDSSNSISKIFVTSPHHFVLYTGERAHWWKWERWFEHDRSCLKWNGKDFEHNKTCDNHKVSEDYYFVPLGVGVDVYDKEGGRVTKRPFVVPYQEVLPCSKFPFLVTRSCSGKRVESISLFHVDIHEKKVNAKKIDEIDGAFNLAWHQKHPMIFATLSAYFVTLWYMNKENELTCIGQKMLDERIKPHCLTWGIGEKSNMLHLCFRDKDKDEDLFFQTLECYGIDEFMEKPVLTEEEEGEACDLIEDIKI